MTDIIIENGTGIVMMTYRDDGKDEVLLVSSKSSILQKKLRIPRSYKKALRALSI
ncbi:MAG: hypothetical protein ACTSPB_13650 [Candidatus Thorarchaeota archaeon]